MLCAWWDEDGVVYYKLLTPDDAVTTDDSNCVVATDSRWHRLTICIKLRASKKLAHESF